MRSRAVRLPKTPQPEAGVTYAQKISKAEAEIDWREDAEEVLRKVRAFNPAPVAQTRWDGAAAAHLGGRAASAPRPRARRRRPGTVIGAAPERHRRGLRPRCAAHHAPAARRAQAHDRGRTPELAAARGGEVLEPMSGAALDARAAGGPGDHARFARAGHAGCRARRAARATATHARTGGTLALLRGGARILSPRGHPAPRAHAARGNPSSRSSARSCRWRCSSSRMRARPIMPWSMRP